MGSMAVVGRKYGTRLTVPLPVQLSSIRVAKCSLVELKSLLYLGSPSWMIFSIFESMKIVVLIDRTCRTSYVTVERGRCPWISVAFMRFPGRLRRDREAVRYLCIYLRHAPLLPSPPDHPTPENQTLPLTLLDSDKVSGRDSPNYGRGCWRSVCVVLPHLTAPFPQEWPEAIKVGLGSSRFDQPYELNHLLSDEDFLRGVKPSPAESASSQSTWHPQPVKKATLCSHP